MTHSLKKDTEDPLGRRTIDFYDCYQRLKTQRIRAKDKTLISQANYEYDGRGNQIKRTHDIFYKGETVGSFAVVTHFDSMNQKVEEIEQNNKSTKWAYKNGKLSTITNPDGVRLAYQYDALNRVRELLSSDKTIHYRYSYDLCDNLVTVEDHVNNLTTERRYDALSRMIYEKQGTGLEFSFVYDSQNRCTSMKFCDGSVVNSYSPTDLIKATRYQKQIPLYNCTLECNWRGNLVKIDLPNQVTIQYEWDKSNRCTSINSETYQEQLFYNPVGKLSRISVKDGIDSYQSLYAYDDLDQITSEKGFFSAQYNYDSLNNRRQKDGFSTRLSEFNQIIDDGNQEYSYDTNGRRKTNGSFKYDYDALGRLTTISDEAFSIKYIYDSFGRRIRAVTPFETTDYLYQFDIEIGAYQNGKLKEFRLLGDNHDTLVVEANKSVYSSLTNHRGDIVQLINANGVAANYRYDAFGNFSAKGSLVSPWLFFSQRYNPQTNLYHFYRREYDPTIGSWLTPDPLGYADGPNLYAYVHNNPLTYVDPYGLWMETIQDFNRGFSRGFIDDTSWGATEYALGEYQSKSAWGTVGNYTGTGVSLAVGMLYGGTEAKLAKNAATFVGKKSYKCLMKIKKFRGSKNLKESSKNAPVKRVIELAESSTKDIAKTGEALSDGSKTFQMAENLNSNGHIRGRKGWELDNFPGINHRNTSTIIQGRRYSGHALDQMQNRGLMPSVVENTIMYGKSYPGKFPKTTHFYDKINNITVILSNDAGVITTSYGKIK